MCRTKLERTIQALRMYWCQRPRLPLFGIGVTSFSLFAPKRCTARLFAFLFLLLFFLPFALVGYVIHLRFDYTFLIWNGFKIQRLHTNLSGFYCLHFSFPTARFWLGLVAVWRHFFFFSDECHTFGCYPECKMKAWARSTRLLMAFDMFIGSLVIKKHSEGRI